MNKIILFGLILGLISVSACVRNDSTGITITPTDKPFIEKITPDKNYLSSGQTMNFDVSVTNPTQVNYKGLVLIQADTPNCFNMLQYIDIGQTQNVLGVTKDIEVSSGTTHSVLVPINITSSAQDTCFQPSRHKLNVFILQNGVVFDSKLIEIDLFK